MPRPALKMEIDGKNRSDLLASVKMAEVEDCIGQVSAFRIEIVGDIIDELLDGKLLNKRIRILMGNAGEALSEVLAGIVSYCNLIWSHESGRVLIVGGFSYLMVFQKSYIYKGCGSTKQKISDVVENIARTNDFECDCESTETTLDSIKQNSGESDLAFMIRMADLFGYSLFTRGRKVHFHKPVLEPAKILSGKWEGSSNINGVINVDCRFSIANAVKEVEARGYDLKKNKPLVSKFSPSYSLNFEPSGIWREPNIVYTSQKETDLFAGSMQSIASKTSEIRVLALGDSSLRAGIAIQVEDFGLMFDGVYLMDHVVHKIDHNGYRVDFQLSGPLLNA
jgi:hypothetical protein